MSAADDAKTCKFIDDNVARDGLMLGQEAGRAWVLIYDLKAIFMIDNRHIHDIQGWLTFSIYDRRRSAQDEFFPPANCLTDSIFEGASSATEMLILARSWALILT